MADKKIDIDVLINTAESAKNIGQLKKAMKELNSAQLDVDKNSPDFKKLSKAINETEGKLGDLNDSFSTLTGSGMERFNKSFGLISEAVFSLDFDKLKIGLSGLKASFLELAATLWANPIMLIAGIILAVGAAIYFLSDSIKPLREMMDSLGKVIGVVIQYFKDLMDAMGLTTFSSQKMGEQMVADAQKTQKAIERRYDAEIKYAGAAGKNTEDLEKAKQKAIGESIKAQMTGLILLRNANGKWTDEQKKQYEDLKIAYANTVIESKVIDIKKSKEAKDEEAKQLKERNDKYKEYIQQRNEADNKLKDKIISNNNELIEDERQKAIDLLYINQEKSLEDITNSKASKKVKDEAYLTQQALFNKQLADINKQFDDADAKIKADKEAKDEADRLKQIAKEDEARKTNLNNKIVHQQLELAKDSENLNLKIELLNAQKDMELELAKDNADKKELIEIEYSKKIEALRESEAKKARDLKIKEVNDSINITQTSLNALNDLSNIYFLARSSQVKKGSKEEMELKKKAFIADKAFKIATATTNGALAITNILATTPDPTGIYQAIRIAAAGTATAFNIAKIASAKFDEGGAATSGGDSASPNIPTPSSVGGSTTPNAPINNFNAGKFYGIGQTTGTDARVYVVESDITKTQRRVASIEQTATQKL